MGQETYKNFLRDFIYLLKEYSDEPVQNDPFNDGEKFAYSRIIDLIESQAVAFGIALEDIGFNDFENYKKRK